MIWLKPVGISGFKGEADKEESSPASVTVTQLLTLKEMLLGAVKELDPY